MRLAAYGFAYRGMVIKQVRRFLRAWVQNLLPSVVTTVLFLVIFGHLVGRELGTMRGVDYADFILPGLIILAVATNAYSNVTLAFYGARLQRHIEELLVAPLPAWLIVAGFARRGSGQRGARTARGASGSPRAEGRGADFGVRGTDQQR